MKIENAIKTGHLPLPRKTVISLIYTCNAVREKMAEPLKPFDVSMEQFNVLRILRGQKGEPANLFTIQERMVSKMSNTTRLVDKLIAKKLVKRNTCEGNRRKVEIFITEKGLGLLSEIDPVITASEEHTVQNLTPEEMDTLNQLLEKMRH